VESKPNNRCRGNSGNRLGSATSRDPTTEQRAELMKLITEYNPQPFATGSPSKAGLQLTAQANELLNLILANVRAAAGRACSRLRLS
jgi:hypothetical protein